MEKSMPDSEVLLVLPNQLFQNHPGLEEGPSKILLIEERLFFGDPDLFGGFHQQKLWYHRATMKQFQRTLELDGFEVDYVEHCDDRNVLEDCLERLQKSGVTSVLVTEPHDHLVSRRMARFCKRFSLKLRVLESPMFLNTTEVNTTYRASKKRWFMSDYYKFQRRRLDVLIDDDEDKSNG